MYKRKQFVAPVIKTGLIAAATVFTAFALLGGGDSSAAQSDRALAQPGGEATGVRVTVKNPRVGTPVRVMHEIGHALALDPGEVVDEIPALRRPAVKPSGGNNNNNNQGGVAGSGCPGEGDCLEAHGGLGCKDEECCDAVCMADAFCCLVGWEQNCVDIAMGTPVCQPPPPDCSEFAAPGAIYSNFAVDCWAGAFTHGANPNTGGARITGDDLWWGNSGGVLEELTFSVYNGAANSNLNAVTLEIILSTTTPGTANGTLNLSTVIATIEVELEDLELEPTFGLLVNVDDLADQNITLPIGGIYASINYISATFEEEGAITALGQVLVNPPGEGASTNSFFLETFSNGAWFGGDPVASFAWEIVADGVFGPERIIYDNAPQQGLDFNGIPFNNVGLGSGPSATAPHNWSAAAFTLPPVPEGGDAWRVTGLFPHGFVAAASVPNITSVDWIIWSRDGENPPIDGDIIAQGSTPFTELQMSHGLHNIGVRVHPIPVDVVLAPGDYYLTVHGNGAVAPAQFAWFMNAGNGIDFLNALGQPAVYRAATFPAPGFAFAHFATVLPNPEQKDPNTTHTHVFFIVGEPDDKDPSTPCPGDLTGSGGVGVADLLALLACWGPVAPGCEAADLTDSGSVGVADLLALLAQWGPCP